MPLRRRDVRDNSVQLALERALKDDGRLSHREVVEIIRSTLDHGTITFTEQEDLRTILHKSTTLSVRSKWLLSSLLKHLRDQNQTPSRFSVPEEASNLVCDFLQRSGGGKFSKLYRDEIGLGLLMRLSKPGLIDQGESSLCGPSSLLYHLASDRPIDYARFGIDLYEKGCASIGKLKVQPGQDCRNYCPRGKIDSVDWMMTASIRDSENWFFDYESVGNEFAGITLPREMANWFEKIGYQDVRNQTNLVHSRGAAAIAEANRLFANKYRVCLLVGDQMLKANQQNQKSATANHWVVLRSMINRSPSGVTLKIFTWGKGEYQVPTAGNLAESSFLNNFYGYVAAKL